MRREEWIYLKLIEAIRDRHPSFSIISKSESSLMKFLNFFVQMFNKQFMTRYVTVLSNTVYVPDSRIGMLSNLWPTLTHEWVHLEQAKRETFFVHMFLYGLPHWLVLLSLGSLLSIWFSSWWLLCLLFLVCLAPLPAYWRMKKELEAYAVNLFIAHLEGRLTPSYINSRIGNFTSSNYYFMWPFKRDMKRRLNQVASEIQSGQYDNKRVFRDIKRIILEVDRGYTD